MSNLLRSLSLTILLTFSVPLLLLGTVLAIFSGISLLPVIAIVGKVGFGSIIGFLTVFGNGYPLQGMFIIGMTCSLVGGAFDIFNVYFYPNIHEH